MTGEDAGEDGLFRAPSIERYWSEPGWRPFLIRASGACAGFVVVSDKSRLVEASIAGAWRSSSSCGGNRRMSVGTRAAMLTFDAFRGPWEVRQMARAAEATAFWRKVIGRYTGGTVRELIWDDARWRGPVQLFDSA